MAARETKQAWSERRVNKMFDSVGKPKTHNSKAMATRVPGKMGPSQRNGATDPKTRHDDKAARGKKMRAHFRSILSGKAGNMQGKK